MRNRPSKSSSPRCGTKRLRTSSPGSNDSEALGGPSPESISLGSPTSKEVESTKAPVLHPEPPPGWEDTVRHLFIRSRWEIKRIAEHLSISPGKVRDLLKREGYGTLGRGCFIRHGVYHRASKLTAAKIQELRTDLKTKPLLNHSVLSRKYKLSRERIRQIAMDMKLPSRHRLMEAARKTLEREELLRREKYRESKSIRRFQQTQRLRDYWAAGYEVAEIAKRMDLQPGTVGVRIVTLRKQYPDWFPFRNIPTYARYADAEGVSPLTPEQERAEKKAKRERQDQELRDYWAAGFKVPEIARRMGLIANTVISRIEILEKRKPQSFPGYSKRPYTPRHKPDQGVSELPDPGLPTPVTSE